MFYRKTDLLGSRDDPQSGVFDYAKVQAHGLNSMEISSFLARALRSPASALAPLSNPGHGFAVVFGEDDVSIIGLAPAERDDALARAEAAEATIADLEQRNAQLLRDFSQLFAQTEAAGAEVERLREAAQAQLDYMDLCGHRGDLERNLRAALQSGGRAND